MIKRPFFGLTTPKPEYAVLDTATSPEEVAVPSRITLFVDAPLEKTDSLMINKGDTVKLGEKITPLCKQFGVCRNTERGNNRLDRFGYRQLRQKIYRRDNRCR